MNLHLEKQTHALTHKHSWALSCRNTVGLTENTGSYQNAAHVPIQTRACVCSLLGSLRWRADKLHNHSRKMNNKPPRRKRLVWLKILCFLSELSESFTENPIEREAGNLGELLGKWLSLSFQCDLLLSISFPKVNTKVAHKPIYLYYNLAHIIQTGYSMR